MDINLKNLYGQGTKESEFAFSLPPEFDGFVFSEIPSVRFTVKSDNAGMKVQMQASAVLNAKCAFCLEDFAYPCATDVTYFVSESDFELSDTQDTQDQLPLQNGVLDGAELARQELLLQLPAAFCCEEGCKGLCLVCGTPKKYGCTCEEPVKDERWQVLKTLLEQSEE